MDFCIFRETFQQKKPAAYANRFHLLPNKLTKLNHLDQKFTSSVLKV